MDFSFGSNFHKSGNLYGKLHVQCSPMKLRILGISLVAMVFVGRFSWTLASSKGIFTGYQPMKQSNSWKNRNSTISRTEGACKVHIHESLWQNVCVTPWKICMQGYGGDKIFRNFIDETCMFILASLSSLRMCFRYECVFVSWWDLFTNLTEIVSPTVSTSTRGYSTSNKHS